MVAIAAKWWQAERPRKAMGLAVQKCKGFHPSEFLALCARNILPPDDVLGDHYFAGVLAQGIRAGIKIKRTQSAVMFMKSLQLHKARRLRQHLQPGDMLIGGLAHCHVAAFLKNMCEVNSMLPFWPHNPRWIGDKCVFCRLGIHQKTLGFATIKWPITPCILGCDGRRLCLDKRGRGEMCPYARQLDPAF